MKVKFFAGVTLCCLLVTGGCVRRVHDYTFAVTGFVTAEDGKPVQGAEITLQVDAPVYEGVTAVKVRQLLTNDNGSFVFMYLTGNASTKYSLTIRKQGFQSETLLGSSPPPAHHVVQLRKDS